MRVAIALALAVALPSCFGGGDQDLSPSGKGRPQVQASFPEQVEPGEVATLVVDVTNPGPGGMESVVVSFSRVGAVGSQELPDPLIDIGVGGDNARIEAIDPEPAATSDDAVLFRFAGLGEGETASYAFDVEVPEREGSYANAVVVYDGAEPQRARGVRVETVARR